ncbi:hypothetical protein BDR22DRAFT_851032 [Usnea florida]
MTSSLLPRKVVLSTQTPQWVTLQYRTPRPHQSRYQQRFPYWVIFFGAFLKGPKTPETPSFTGYRI